jgi:hypothetical protein
MTSSPIRVLAPDTVDPHAGARQPQRVGLGSPDPALAAILEPAPMWFIAICHRCNPDFGQPFGDEDERDEWAAAHAVGTGHVVQLLIEVQHAELGGHTTAMLRFEDDRGWWLCTAEPCVRWNGPYVSAQLAAASFRSHRKAHRP